ncbi:MAG TPA: DUF4062 domain-containing protein [Thermoanaerobaculia bacterium]|jgi:hypothetical protein|nr:DUF4062 domain-containing protein [Thermoanaerobaculia bacterium]
MRKLSPTERAQVFISSRNTYLLGGETLSKIRSEIAGEIEKRFPFLAVNINEDWPATGAGDPRRTTQYAARTCHLFLGILVDDYGYVDLSGASATQIEFDAARNDSREKMLVFIQSSLMDEKGEPFQRQPPAYQNLLRELSGFRSGKLVKTFTAKEDLKASILDAINLYCASTLRAIRKFPAYASGKTSEELEWELKTFSERHAEMLEAFQREAEMLVAAERHIQSFKLDRLTGPGDRHARFLMEVGTGGTVRPVPVIFSACPDRFSYPDAAQYVGYPFRSCVENWQDDLGPLHLVCVFRTITDTQVRRHLGNPDIHVTKEGWGFFAADPERFIQAAYLVGCSSPRRLIEQIQEFFAWLGEYEQLELLVDRAGVQGRILKARSPSPGNRAVGP